MSVELELSPPIWKIYKTKKFNRLMQVFDEITNIIMSSIDKAIKRSGTREHSDSADRSVLEKLLEINRNMAIVTAYDMLLAGIDTVVIQILLFYGPLLLILS